MLKFQCSDNKNSKGENNVQSSEKETLNPFPNIAVYPRIATFGFNKQRQSF